MDRNIKNNYQVFLILVVISLLFGPGSSAQENEIRSPDEILAGIESTPTPEAIIELFINCSEWDKSHEGVRDPSRQALIDLGALAVPTILDNWLHSVDLRRRIELDNIIRGIGHPCAEYLIPYLESPDNYTRRHTGYLLGDTAAILALDDPLALGPLDEDLPAIQALKDALLGETDWHVTRQMIGGLGKMRDPSQIDFLSSWLNDDEQATRLGTVIALGKIPDQNIVPYLISAFGDPLATVRQASVLALSTQTNGNLAFEALKETVTSSPNTDPVVRVCALEALTRYLDAIVTDRSEHADSQRYLAFHTAMSMIENMSGDMWTIRGYAVTLISYTYERGTAEYLENLLGTEEHPFVIGKITEALDLLAEGMPEPEEEDEPEN